MNVEKARVSDVQPIYELVNSFAERGEMLPRALSDIYENIRDYFVIRDSNSYVLACVALHISWADLAEIRSLAVSEYNQTQGLGSMLVKACLEDTVRKNVGSV